MEDITFEISQIGSSGKILFDSELFSFYAELDFVPVRNVGGRKVYNRSGRVRRKITMLSPCCQMAYEPNGSRKRWLCRGCRKDSPWEPDEREFSLDCPFDEAVARYSETLAHFYENDFESMITATSLVRALFNFWDEIGSGKRISQLVIVRSELDV